MIKEQNIPDLTTEQEKDLKDFFDTMSEWQSLQKTKGERSLGEGFYAAYEELDRMKVAYGFALFTTSVMGQILWNFYARPTGKISFAAWKTFCRFAQSRIGALVKMRDSIQGSLSGRKPIPISHDSKLPKMINDVVELNNKPATASKWGPTALRRKTSGLLTFGRLGKLLSIVAGAMMYSADPYDPNKNGADDNDEFYTWLKGVIYNKFKNWAQLEILWASIRIKPLLETGDVQSRKNIMLYGTIGGAFFLGLAKRSFFALRKSRHPITIAQAEKIFEDAVLTSMRSGAGKLQDDIIEGTSKAVDDVFDKFTVTNIPDELGARHGGAIGEAYLKEKIKKALELSVRSSEESAVKIFNKLVKDLSEDFNKIKQTSTGGVSNKAAQIDYVNRIIVKCYEGGNRGIDNAIFLASKRLEKNKKRAEVFWRDAARSERAHLVNSLKTVGQSKISKSLDDTVGEFDKILRLRREAYSASVQDLLLDLRAIDEDFLTYHYLSNAKPPSVKGGSQAGADAAASRLRRPSNGETHFMKLGQAKEEVMNRFRKELEEINKIFKEAENQSMNIAEPLEILDNAKINKAVEEAYEIVYTRAKDGAMKVDDWFKNGDNVKGFELYDETLLLATKRGDNGVDEATSVLNALKPANDDVPFNQLEENFINALSNNPDAKTEFANILEHLQDGKSAFGRGKGQELRRAIAESTGRQRTAAIAGLFSVAYLIFKSNIFSSKNYKEYSPIGLDTGDTIVEAVNDNDSLAIVLQSFNKDGSFNFGKVYKIGKAAGLFQAEGLLNKALWGAHGKYWTESTKNGKTTWTVKEGIETENGFPKIGKSELNEVLQVLKKEASDASILASKKALSVYFSAAAKRNKRLNYINFLKALQITTVYLAYSGLRKENMLLAFLSHQGIGPRTFGSKKDMINILIRQGQLKKNVQANLNSEILKKIEKGGNPQNESVSRDDMSIILGTRNFLTEMVRETIKEYRALDNYNQYPYHSGIGTDEEPAADFMEDWKDFELSLVRDESRGTAIELAKILVKDLELFGDVVDLVGKNQSVSTEILKKIRNNQEKEK